MTTIALVGLAIAVLASLYDWRRGLFLCIAVGFAQDPIRKLLPGSPVAAVVAVVAVFGASVIGLMFRSRGLGLKVFLTWNRRLATPLVVFTVLAVIQSVRSFFQYGNPVLSGLGLLAYLSPTMAILVFFKFGENFETVEKWLKVYVAAALLLAFSVMADFLGFESALFRSIGADTVYGIGGRVQMYCGFMRSSEISAVHLGTGAALLVALLGQRLKRWQWAVGVPSVALMVLAILVSGRRKMLVQFVVYLILYLALARGTRTKRARRAVLATVGFAGVGGLIGMFIFPEFSGALVPYAERGGSVLGEAVDRLWYMTVTALGLVFRESGIIGAGAGTATQGSQYFGGASEIVRSEAEGGLGRVMAELGLVGIIVFLFLGLRLIGSLARARRLALRVESPKAPLIVGLALLGPTHGLVFAAAHQAYGDPFVLLILGGTVGIALSYPRWQFGHHLHPPGATSWAGRSGLSGLETPGAERTLDPMVSGLTDRRDSSPSSGVSRV